MSPGSRASFVVRVVQGGRGQVNGVIERVATGARKAFTGTEAIGRVIAEMLRGARPPPRAVPGTPPPRGEKPRTGRSHERQANERGDRDGQ